MARVRDERAGATLDVASLVARESAGIQEAATPERREQMRRAEESRSVYRAWNAVCAGTREGAHVTGLRFLPESNELLVYLDSSAWTQEMTMLREIIRARMEREGVKLDGFKFRTSKEGYSSAARRRLGAGGTAGPAAHRGAATGKLASFSDVVQAAPGHERTRAPRADLTDEERAALSAAVAPIEDKRLQKSLKTAMEASLEWKKGRDAQNMA